MKLEKIEDIEIYEEAKQKDIALRGDFRTASNWYSSLKEGKQIKFTENQIISIHEKILRELLKRGKIKFNPDGMEKYSKELFFKNLPNVVKKFIEVKDLKKIFEEKNFSEIEDKIKKEIPYFIISKEKVYGIIGFFKDYKILADWEIPLISKIEDDKIIVGGFEKENKETIMKPYPNEHSARIHSPDKYIRFRRQNNKLGEGIHVIFGITADEKTEIQSIRFSASKFSVAEAKTWLKEHDFRPISFEPAIKKDSSTLEKVKFIFQKHWFENPIIIPFGSSEEYFDLKIEENESSIIHWVLEKSLIDTSKTISYLKSCTDKKLMEIGKEGKVELKPGTTYNPTKDTLAWIEALDYGECIILEKNDTFTKIEFCGKILKGIYIFERESENSQFYLIKPFEKPSPKKKFKNTFKKEIPIMKIDEEKHIVYGIIYQPYEKDAQGDWSTPTEIRAGAHKFLKDYRTIKLQHQRKAEGCNVIESYVLQNDQNLFGKIVKDGTWILAVEIVNPEIWNMIIKGQLTGFSMAGTAIEEEG